MRAKGMSLPTKIIMASTCIIIVALAACLSFTFVRARSMALNDAKAQAVSMIQTLDSTLRSDDTPPIIQQTLDNLRRQDPLLKEFTVYKIDGQSGTAIAALDSASVGTKAAEEDVKSAERNTTVPRVDSGVVDVTAPLSVSGQIAYVAGVQVDIHGQLRSIQNLLLTTIIIGLLAMILGSLVMYLLSRRMLTLPLRGIVKAAQAISSGQLNVALTREVRRKDELGTLASSFTDMTVNLRRLIGQIAEAAERLAAASQQLTASSEETSEVTGSVVLSVQEMAVGSEQQSATVSQTVVTVERISGNVENIAGQADAVSATVRTALGLADQGNQAVGNTVSQMNAISMTVNEAAESIQELVQHANSIGQVSEVITSISDQTNLLALNASIEAARAGEQGRGFAVVATEIRTLAEQSRSSAAKISDMIVTVQTTIRQVVDSISAGTQEVATGMDVVQVAGHAPEQIRAGVQDVSHQISVVAEAVKQVNSGTAQVRESISAVAEVAQSTATSAETISAATQEQLAAMEEITASATSMATMAQSLQASVSEFVL